MIINSNATAVASNPGTVQLNGGTLGCGAYDLQAFDTHYHGGAAMNGFDVNGTLFNGDVSTFAIFFPDVGGGGLVTPLKFTDVTIDGAGFAANARGLHVAGAGNVTIEGLLLKNKTNAGVMLSARGARGSFSNIRFQNVAADSMGGTD
jgi:hypothetical protein